MKLSEIKAHLIEAYFSASGDGIDEDRIADYSGNLFKLVEARSELTAPQFEEHDDATIAYRALAKGNMSIGYILDEGQVLYVVTRSGKRFASVNLTSPSRTERQCTLREVRDVFNQAAELGTAVTFKVASA